MASTLRGSLALPPGQCLYGLSYCGMKSAPPGSRNVPRSHKDEGPLYQHQWGIVAVRSKEPNALDALDYWVVAGCLDHAGFLPHFCFSCSPSSRILSIKYCHSQRITWPRNGPVLQSRLTGARWLRGYWWVVVIAMVAKLAGECLSHALSTHPRSDNQEKNHSFWFQYTRRDEKVPFGSKANDFFQLQVEEVFFLIGFPKNVNGIRGKTDIALLGWFKMVSFLSFSVESVCARILGASIAEWKMSFLQQTCEIS